MSGIDQLFNDVNQRMQNPQQNTQKTAYQSNLAQYQTDKWYKGSIPTTSEMYGRIFSTYQTDPQSATAYATAFSQAQADPSSPWYNPYKQATNPYIAEMASYGVDVSNIDDKWFSDNSYLLQYTPSNAKKASKEQKMAYAYNQIADAYGDTSSAWKEYAALQDEINYLARWEGKNYSNDDIRDIVYGKDGSKFAKKYPTLAKMDASYEIGGNIVKLNSAMEYSKDNLDTMIWRARNGGGTGSFEIDSALSVLGDGNSWTDNPEISAKMCHELKKILL